MNKPIPPNEILEKPKPPANESSVHGFEWWRRTFQYKTGMGLTAAEKKQYENDYEFVLQRKQCNECYQYRDWILQYSPTVIFMAQQIARLNSSGQVSNGQPSLKFDESKIICDVCPEWRSGGFHPELGILLCQNRIRDKWHLEDTLAHEMVHYYDNTRWKVDWLALKHHACSEIRASSLSGECRFMQEFARRGLGFKVSRGHQECVRRRATLSVMGNPNCKDEKHAQKIVDEVWDSCFGDTRPFDEIYR
ncbi:LAME_0H14796g1_1 [Lachancea meyersii CBS 8951]|uniref:Mitochondrial inner membrane protease ATP23 n=1 Tax=Lachancea meyersii CBS 8951 TaxID=1266667 RepID=A0A1G4KHN6_9SACH|nr:LAME_0H14796g1_1 [Lachancea meyersii CBS 8951]